MNPCEDHLCKLERELPDMCRVRDLIKAGIFNSATVACQARLSGNCPQYFQMRKRGTILYPRSAVIQWLREKINVRYNPQQLCAPTQEKPRIS